MGKRKKNVNLWGGSEKVPAGFPVQGRISKSWWYDTWKSEGRWMVKAQSWFTHPGRDLL